MTTYRSTKAHARRACREVKVGDVLWTVHDVAKNIAPYEDPHLVERHVVTHKQAITGIPMCGSVGLQTLIVRDGPVYTSRPGKWRALHEPAPQVSGPLSKRTNRRLDAREIAALEQEVTAALERRYSKGVAKRKVAAAKGNQKKLLELVR